MKAAVDVLARDYRLGRPADQTARHRPNHLVTHVLRSHSHLHSERAARAVRTCSLGPSPRGRRVASARSASLLRAQHRAAGNSTVRWLKPQLADEAGDVLETGDRHWLRGNTVLPDGLPVPAPEAARRIVN